MTEFAFVLGNGKTRLAFNIPELRSRGMVYACNAVYRTDEVDVLISTDPGISREIIESGYPDIHVHYTRERNIKPGVKSKALDPRWQGYSSGPNALAQACKDGYPYCFMIGMDLVSDNSYINNLYAGTDNYKNTDSEPTYHGNWENQITEIIQEFSTTRIVHVNPLLKYTPESWKLYPNFEVHTVDKFKAMINI